ncbi:MAG: 30S ribosomal protein S9 [Candidatus Aenigmatarchaeota archaeon]|nr:MAG: 30S ribosomal protein S9 [Candidatus Aenigmarchaeota archaeon]
MVEKILQTVGKRKRAVARAVFRPGKGRVTVNSQPLENFQNEIIRLKMQEPLLLAGDGWKKWDIRIRVDGGGIMGQAEAVRQAIARGLSQLLGEKVKKQFLAYDRTLLVSDPRRNEPAKPPHSSWGARRYKQRSKR